MFEKPFKQIELFMLTQCTQCLQRQSQCILHGQVMLHYDVPDLLFQSSLTTKFNVKETHVHTNTANKKMKY